VDTALLGADRELSGVFGTFRSSVPSDIDFGLSGRHVCAI
jgi:hypothetical protein